MSHEDATYFRGRAEAEMERSRKAASRSAAAAHAELAKLLLARIGADDGSSKGNHETQPSGPSEALHSESQTAGVV